MKTKETNESRKNGSTLVTVLIVSFIVTTLLSIGLQQGVFQYKLTVRSIQWEEALGIAEGGAEVAVAKIAYSKASGLGLSSVGSGTINGHNYAYQLVGDRIESQGTVGDVTRSVVLSGLAQGYWSKWAYFANYFNSPNADGTPGSAIWLITGDEIFGPVHCNDDIYIAGSPIFHGDVSLVGNIVEHGSYNNNPVYHQGLPQQVTTIPLDQIDFSTLKNNATIQGIVVSGSADIDVNDDVVTIVNNSTTNSYTIGENNNNIIYVENSLVADPGAGAWMSTNITEQVDVWVPSYSTQWVAGAWSGAINVPGTGWQPPSGWYKQGGKKYKFVGWKWRSSMGQWWMRYHQKGKSYKYVSSFQYQDVAEVISTDEKMDAHYEYIAKAKSGWPWALAYIEPHDYYTWQDGSNMVAVTSSNLTTITTNYTEQVWVPDTNATVVAEIGTASIDGQLSMGLTVVTEGDITITGDYTYMDEKGTGYAYTNPASDVMSALISGSDIIVANDNPYASGDRTIHASIMATGALTGSSEGDPYSLDGRFYVEDYNQGNYNGELHVYGGIIQNWRGAVGTFGGGGPRSGFTKDYVYDLRFSPTHGKAPPACPLIDANFTFTDWSEL